MYSLQIHSPAWITILLLLVLHTTDPLHTLFIPHIANTAPCQPNLLVDSNNVADASTICFDTMVTGSVSIADQDDTYRIFLTSGQSIQINMTGVGGDADLYLYPPASTDITVDLWTTRATNTGSNEIIRIYIPHTGYWYINVHAYAGATTYELTVTQTQVDLAAD